MPPRKLALLFLFLSALIWGIATPVIKSTVAYVPPFTFLMLRFWIAGIITIPMSYYYFTHYQINFERVKKLIFSSTIGYVLCLSFIFIGLSKTSAIEGSILSVFSPLLISFLGFLILKDLITKKEIEGTMIAFIGALIIILGPLLTNPTSPANGKLSLIGNIIFLVGVFFDSIYVIYVKKNLSSDKIIKPFMLVIISFAFALIAFTPLGIIEQYNIYSKSPTYGIPLCSLNQIDKSQYDNSIICDQTGCLTKPDSNKYECLLNARKHNFSSFFYNNLCTYTNSKALIGIIYMSFLSGIIAYAFFQFGLKNIEASEASLFYYLQPLFAMPIAFFFLKENLSIEFIIGAILITLGVYRAEKI